ncbi:hypothetical protein BDN67DRAFT_867396, partial [Paxillus ammoniavirescens]
TNIADLIPMTPNEALLLAMLQEANIANTVLKEGLIQSQAVHILHEMYCATLCGQLAHHQEKNKNGQNKGKVLGDGLPCLLSGDTFF